MTRVLLINPPSPEQLAAPLLGQQYVAAALLARGCEVRVLDAAARSFPLDFAGIVAEAEAFQPDLIGLGLFTRWVWHAYRLVDALRGRFPMLVAGGAHPTVRPDEALERGFDVAVIGEGEQTVARLVDVLEGRCALRDVAGIRYRDAAGAIQATPPAPLQEDLDALASPVDAQDLYDPSWYAAPDDGGESGTRPAVPIGMLTSRGCPARCTFCANYVTGRRFRYRSPASVIAELKAYQARTGMTFVPFWDDALTANLKRVHALCAAFETELEFPSQWGAITRATHVNRELLRAMKRAGCINVDFGVESGDDAILKAIKKGLKTDQVVRALEAAKAEGLRTACNFMLGFPQEDAASLKRTLRFMERIAPLVDSFSTLGVLVPFPGTPLYEDYHLQHGFTDWWLREDHARYTAPPPLEPFEAFHRYYIQDTNLELDFFDYSADVKELIRTCLRFKAEHNLRKMGLLPASSLKSSAAE